MRSKSSTYNLTGCSRIEVDYDGRTIVDEQGELVSIVGFLRATFEEIFGEGAYDVALLEGDNLAIIKNSGASIILMGETMNNKIGTPRLRIDLMPDSVEESIEIRIS